jgi:hypothetical protein
MQRRGSLRARYANGNLDRDPNPEHYAHPDNHSVVHDHSNRHRDSDADRNQHAGRRGLLSVRRFLRGTNRRQLWGVRRRVWRVLLEWIGVRDCDSNHNANNHADWNRNSNDNTDRDGHPLRG